MSVIINIIRKGIRGKSGKTTEEIRQENTTVIRFHQNLLRYRVLSPIYRLSRIHLIQHLFRTSLRTATMANFLLLLPKLRGDSAQRFAEMPAYARCRVCGFAVAARCRINGKVWFSRQWNKHYSSRPEVWCFGLKMDERISGGILRHRPAHSLFFSPGIEINYSRGNRCENTRAEPELFSFPRRGREEGR